MCLPRADAWVVKGRHMGLQGQTHGSSGADTWVFRGRHMGLPLPYASFAGYATRVPRILKLLRKALVGTGSSP